MDSEHRHELNDNVLAGWLADKIETVKPHLPLILLGFLGALAASLIWSSWSNSSTQSEESAWQRYSWAVDSGLPSLPALEQVMDEHQGESVGPWAAITWADGQLANAAQSLLLSREQAIGNLDQAQAKYEELLESGGVPASIKHRAQLGLARAYELRGEVDKAKSAYEAVEGAFAEIAAERAAELDDERAQEDIVWLATAKSSPIGFNPGAAARARPDAQPDPLALPDDDESAEDEERGARAAEDTFSDLLNSLQSPVVSEAAAPADTAPAEEPSAGETADDAAAAGDESMEGNSEPSAGGETPPESSTAEEPMATESDAAAGADAEAEPSSENPAADDPAGESEPAAESSEPAAESGAESGADDGSRPETDASNDE